MSLKWWQMFGRDSAKDGVSSSMRLLDVVLVAFTKLKILLND